MDAHRHRLNRPLQLPLHRSASPYYLSTSSECHIHVSPLWSKYTITPSQHTSCTARLAQPAQAIQVKTKNSVLVLIKGGLGRRNWLTEMDNGDYRQPARNALINISRYERNCHCLRPFHSCSSSPINDSSFSRVLLISLDFYFDSVFCTPKAK